MSNGTPRPYEPPNGDDRGRPGAGRARPPRSRGRALVALAVAGWAVLEIWLLTLLAGAVGGLGVLAVLLAGLVLGALAIKRAGRRAWRRLSEELHAQAAAQQPSGAAPEAAATGRGGNALAMLGGLLLMVPGLVSDAIGLLCLFPPTAALLRRGTERLLARGELGEAMRQARGAGDQMRIHRPDGKVVPGEVVRDDEPPRD